MVGIGNVAGLTIFINLLAGSFTTNIEIKAAYIVGAILTSSGFGLIIISVILFIIKDAFKSWKKRNYLHKCDFKHCLRLTNRCYSGVNLCNKHWNKMLKAMEREEIIIDE